MRNLKITKAKYVGAYKINLIFSDNRESIVDFQGFLESSSHPEIKKYLNQNKFKRFNIVNGDLMWGDYELIFPIADLSKGKITHKKKKEKHLKTWYQRLKISIRL